MKIEIIAMDTTIQQPNTAEVAPEQPAKQQPPSPIPSNTTPQEFYAEITKRADVRVILEELATG